MGACCSTENEPPDSKQTRWKAAELKRTAKEEQEAEKKQSELTEQARRKAVNIAAHERGDLFDKQVREKDKRERAAVLIQSVQRDRQARRKASLLRKEKAAEQERTELRNCGGCTKMEREAGQFNKCGRCKEVRYCSRECQVKHWKKGGHKEECGKPDVLTCTTKRKKGKEQDLKVRQGGKRGKGSTGSSKVSSGRGHEGGGEDDDDDYSNRSSSGGGGGDGSGKKEDNGGQTSEGDGHEQAVRELHWQYAKRMLEAYSRGHSCILLVPMSEMPVLPLRNNFMCIIYSLSVYSWRVNGAQSRLKCKGAFLQRIGEE